MKTTRRPFKTMRAKWREYTAYVHDEHGTIYRGFGMTLDRAIARESAHYERQRDLAVVRFRQPVEDFAREHPDTVIWEGLRVVALLRPRPDGSLQAMKPGAPGPDEGGGDL